MSGVVPDAKQPFKVWKCERCAHICLDEWVDGTHRDPYNPTKFIDGKDQEYRCDGQPTGPFYLISQDDYLDVLLAAGGPA